MFAIFAKRDCVDVRRSIQCIVELDRRDLRTELPIAQVVKIISLRIPGRIVRVE